MKKNNAIWVGVDLGGTKMMAVVYDDNFKVLGREKKKTRSKDGNEPILDRLIRTIAQALDSAKIDVDRVSGVGLGCAAPLDLDRGVITEAPNLEWKDVPIRDVIEKRFKCHVAVANDVDAGLYGEYVAGAAEGARCAVGIFPGTGVGGACVYRDRIVTGRNSSCMEIGHIPVIPNGQLCGCGGRGCLETVASRLAIAGASAQAVARGDAPALARLAGTDIANIRSSALAEAIKEGDKAIETIVRQAAAWIGAASGYCVNLLAPDVVVIGGGLAEAMPKLFEDEVTEAARRTCMPAYRKSFKVRIASLGDDCIVRGAAALVAEAVENES